MSATLVLDGLQRSALAATRSLGRMGISVYVADTCSQSLAAASKYCDKNFEYPDPRNDARGMLDAIVRLVKQHDITTLMPMTDLSTHLLLSNRDSLPNVQMPCPELDYYSTASDKRRILDIACDAGIAVPESIYINSRVDFDAALANVSYPVIIKPRRSQVPTAEGYEATSVRLAHSREELVALIESAPGLVGDGFLLQEFIPGSGAGVFALYDRGRPVATFAHRRVREKPPSGGVSVLSESVEVDPELGRLSRTLLESLKWHGPAMVEYRITPDGKPYLMEINARFWGSLQLAVSAGVNFPHLAWQVANGLQPPAIESYKTGVRNRWLLGDLDSLYLKLRDKKRGSGEKLGDIFSFLNFFSPRTKFEVCQSSDLGPFRYELAQYWRSLRK
jgi:predicted ATP-grasp superfamily ATP-dependent carboligase